MRWQSITVTVLKLRVVIRRHSGGPNGRPLSSRRLRLPPSTRSLISPSFTRHSLEGKKKTWKDDVAKIRRYLLPPWGEIPLRSITRVHVHELLDKLSAQGMTVGVNRVQALISRLFTLALDRSLVDAHPAARMMKRFQERPSDRVLSDDELRALWKGLDAHSGRASDAIRLRLLLGQRGQEVVGMKWNEIDFVAKTWDMPGGRTKNRRPHCVPLPPTALALLKRRRQAISDV